ncbi:hypothetical protein Tsubulata_040503, partial [Turnera subulata]
IFRQKLQILLQHNLFPEFVFDLGGRTEKALVDQIQSQLRHLYQKYNVEDKCEVNSCNRGESETEVCEKMRKMVYKYMKIEGKKAINSLMITKQKYEMKANNLNCIYRSNITTFKVKWNIL